MDEIIDTMNKAQFAGWKSAGQELLEAAERILGMEEIYEYDYGSDKFRVVKIKVVEIDALQKAVARAKAEGLK